jgi:hypothetical protein
LLQTVGCQEPFDLLVDGFDVISVSDHYVLSDFILNLDLDCQRLVIEVVSFLSQCFLVPR